jgi:hypothetical protein
MTAGASGDNGGMSASDTHRSHDALLQELAAERVAALSRIARTLESLIAELVELRLRVSSARGAERGRALEHYRGVRERALEYRWYLEVQREAMGLRHHPAVDEHYAVPGPIDA